MLLQKFYTTWKNNFYRHFRMVLQHMIATLGYMHSCSMPSRVNILAKKVINLLVKSSLKATAEDELKCIRFTLLWKSCPDDIRLHTFQKGKSDSWFGIFSTQMVSSYHGLFVFLFYISLRLVYLPPRDTERVVIIPWNIGNVSRGIILVHLIRVVGLFW